MTLCLILMHLQVVSSQERLLWGIVKASPLPAPLSVEGQSYIEEAFANLFYREGEPEKVCFMVTLKGNGLEEHMDEISALITGGLDSCDLENSCIRDLWGAVYPAK